jgi:SagB-type dehydrogenase family enzyme
MKTIITILLSAFLLPALAQDIKLPAPVIEGGKPLMEALQERQSSRAYSERELDSQTLSNLLWAAYGYNRLDEKKRTAPTSRNLQEIDVYVSLKSGLYLYDSEKNLLVFLLGEDIRAATGSQQFAATAPVNLIFVANQNRVREPHGERQLKASYTNAGYISQNVYLFCASENLATVARGAFNAETLKEATGLGDDMIIILTQTVGYHQE